MTAVRKVLSLSPSEIRKWVARMLGIRRRLALIERHGVAKGSPEISESVLGLA
jgi:hypothetical protein